MLKEREKRTCLPKSVCFIKFEQSTMNTYEKISDVHFFAYLFLYLVILISSGNKLLSDEYKLYEHLYNPESISYIDDSHILATKCSSGIGCGYRLDEKDSAYYVIAEDTGAGIISHFWAQYYLLEDSTFYVRLIIDDSVIIEQPLREYFSKDHGVLRYPLHTTTSGAFLSNIQIPYKKNFKVETRRAAGGECVLFWGVQWKPIDSSRIKESFSLSPSREYTDDLTKAERFYLKYNKIDRSLYQRRWGEISANPGDSLSVLDNWGPGVIHDMVFNFGNVDRSVLDSVFIQINYDGDPNPGVKISVNDLFAAGVENYNLISFYIEVMYYDIWELLFPIPFRHDCNITIINKSSVTLPVKCTCYFEPKDIDLNQYGYFYVHESLSYPTKMNIPHPVVNIKGRGRYVGTILYVTNNHDEPHFMEGDPRMLIDSSGIITYPGTEDFFTGGWYFLDGPFTNATSGCISRWSTMFRFHVLDCIDFRNSFDFQMQHGVSNDFNGDYKTVAFYYKKFTPFWINQDTVRIGNDLQVNGAYYPQYWKINISIDGIAMYYGECDSSGNFHFPVNIPETCQEGYHTVAVNGVESPDKIFITKTPIIRMLKDSANCKYHENDTLEILGYGFNPRKQINFLLNESTMLQDTAVTDNDGAFRKKIILPPLKEGMYRLGAHSELNNVYTSDSVEITRDYNVEFEEMKVLYSDAVYYRSYTGFCGLNASRKYMLYFSTELPYQSITLQFNSSVSDTFQLSMFTGVLKAFGIFNIILDDKLISTVDLYDHVDYGVCRRSSEIILDTMFISKGTHIIKIANVGKNAQSVGYQGSFDNLIMHSITNFHNYDMPNKDTLQGDSYSDKIFIYPNPVEQSSHELKVKLNSTVLHRYKMELYDFTGRNLGTVYNFSGKDDLVTINLPPLGAGCYLVKIQDTDSSGLRFFTLLVTGV